jgi:hypothetical protein
MKKILFIALLFSVGKNYAQTDLEKLRNDIVNFTYGYVDPAADLAVNIAQSNWTNSAKVNKQWKVSFSLLGNYIFVGDANKTVVLNNSDLEILTIVGGQTSAVIPTILGGYTDVQLEGDVDLLGSGTISHLQFYAPNGMGSKTIASYAIQANMGLGYDTDLFLRYVPETKIDEVINKGYGLGLKHNFSRWFKGFEAKKIDLALFISYAKFNISNDIIFNIPGEQIDRSVADGSTTNYQILASKNIKDTFTLNFNFAYLVNSYTPSFEGTGTLLLPILNDGLAKDAKTVSSIKIDLGASYKYKNFDFYTSFAYSNFPNISMGINYNL